MKLTFEDAITRIKAADLVTIKINNFNQQIASYLNYEDETDDDSDFVIGFEGADDVYISKEDGAILHKDGTMSIPGYTVTIGLYKNIRD